MIAIRIDGNSQIGMGHIMRCHAIAEEIEKLDEKVIAFCSDSESELLVRSCGINCEIINSKWNDLNSEIDTVILLLKKYQVKKLLIDTYFVTEKYLNALSSFSKTCYIDDLFSFKYPVDMLINYNISYELFDYASAYSGSNTKLILGPLYAPLRKEFNNIIQHDIKDEVSNILVTTGGSDNFDICGSLIEKIATNYKLQNINFNIIAGPFFKSINKLKEDSKIYSNILINENVKSISKIMRSSDIAIAASGSTFIELCVCGVPSVIFSIADNQDSIISTIKNKKLAVTVGKYNGNQTIDSIISSTIQLTQDKKIRSFYHRQMLSVTDGKGAARLAQQIISL